MPSWRVASALVLIVASAFVLAFGIARLVRGGSSSSGADPAVVQVPGSRIATFGQPAHIPPLRRR